MFWPSASSPMSVEAPSATTSPPAIVLAHLHQRTLVDVGVLVGAGVLGEVVDVHARFARARLVVVHAHHDAARVHVVDAPAAARLHRGARVDRDGALDARAHQRLFGAQAGHCLALHVRAHQRAVGVVVLEERDQRGGHRDDLRGRHVDVLDLVGRGQRELVPVAARDQLVGELAVLVEFGVGLRDHVLAFLDRREVLDVLGDLGVLHAAVRRLDEAVLVGARVERQRVDEADVRAFRRFDRAHAAVVRRVHVAHLEAGALAREAARAERGDAPLVRDLRERVGLVHELRQLRGAEELLDRRGDGLRVDQVVRHQVLALGLREALAHRALHAHQARAELVLRELAHGTHAAVAEVVDVVDLAAAVAQLHQDLDHRHDVVVGERHRPGELVAAHAAVELHAAHVGEVVAVLAEEQAVEQGLHGVFGRRLAGAHHAVDRDLGVQLRRSTRPRAGSARCTGPGRGRWCRWSSPPRRRRRGSSSAPPR